MGNQGQVSFPRSWARACDVLPADACCPWKTPAHVASELALHVDVPSENVWLAFT